MGQDNRGASLAVDDAPAASAVCPRAISNRRRRVEVVDDPGAGIELDSFSIQRDLGWPEG